MGNFVLVVDLEEVIFVSTASDSISGKEGGSGRSGAFRERGKLNFLGRGSRIVVPVVVEEEGRGRFSLFLFDEVGREKVPEEVEAIGIRDIDVTEEFMI